MHTRTFVLLPPAVARAGDLDRAVFDALWPHRRPDDADTDDPDSFRGHYDYRGGGADGFDDPATARELGVQDSEVFAKNVRWVRDLPPDYQPGAVVTPDGAWHDSFDDGWRMMNTPAENAPADAAWDARVRGLFARHADCLAVEVDTHS